VVFNTHAKGLIICSYLLLNNITNVNELNVEGRNCGVLEVMILERSRETLKTSDSIADFLGRIQTFTSTWY
jgi:hypothetical protein